MGGREEERRRKIGIITEELRDDGEMRTSRKMGQGDVTELRWEKGKRGEKAKRGGWKENKEESGKERRVYGRKDCKGIKLMVYTMVW